MSVADLSSAEQVPVILVFRFQYVRWHLYIETAPRMSKFSWPYDRLKIKSCCDAKFVVTVSTAGCRYDNPLWYQWWQSWHPMTWFSVFIISLVDHHCFGMILCHRYNPIFPTVLLWQSIYTVDHTWNSQKTPIIHHHGQIVMGYLIWDCTILFRWVSAGKT